jgi:hypothetical protein
MSESVFEDIDDVLPPEPNGEIVHWMEARPIQFGPAGISLATASAFALGALTTVAVLGLMHWLGPQREAPRLPLRFRRRAD